MGTDTSCLTVGPWTSWASDTPLAQRPQAGPLGGGAGDRGVEDQPRPDRLAESGLQRGVARRRRRDRRARPGRTTPTRWRTGPRARLATTRSRARSRDQLPGGEPVAPVVAQHPEQLRGGRDVAERHPARSPGDGVAGCSASTAAVTTPERALGADEELLEVVAGVVLAQRAQPVPHPPVGQHHLEAQHQVAHHPVAQHRGTAGVGRDVAADRAAALATRGSAGTAGRPRPPPPAPSPATTPASTVIVSPTASTSRTARIRPSDSTTWEPESSGTAPPLDPGVAALRDDRHPGVVREAQDVGDLGGARRGVRRPAAAPL